MRLPDTDSTSTSLVKKEYLLYAVLSNFLILGNCCNWSQLLFLEVFCITVCIGVSTTTPLFYQAPLKSANCLSPPFLGNSPLYIGFSWTPRKYEFFSEPP